MLIRIRFVYEFKADCFSIPFKVNNLVLGKNTKKHLQTKAVIKLENKAMSCTILVAILYFFLI